MAVICRGINNWRQLSRDFDWRPLLENFCANHVLSFSRLTEWVVNLAKSKVPNFHLTLWGCEIRERLLGVGFTLAPNYRKGIVTVPMDRLKWALSHRAGARV